MRFQGDIQNCSFLFGAIPVNESLKNAEFWRLSSRYFHKTLPNLGQNGKI